MQQQEVFTAAAQAPAAETSSTMVNIRVLLMGIFFGVVLTKGQVISWFEIQKMFRFESFHMYGVIGSAVVVGAISLLIIKRLNPHTIDGDTVKIKNKKRDKGTIIGGIIFGLGWAVTGACPAPIYAQIGSGTWLAVVTLVGATAGAYLFALLQPRLPK
ncbi:MAG: DUF6691 family protein [Candidatus Promineifilaceae bacterium]